MKKNWRSGRIKLLSCLIIFSGLCLVGIAWAANYPKVKSVKIDRSMPDEARSCIECHSVEHPGLFADWTASRHANAGITCYDCHKAEPGDKDISKSHDKEYGTKSYPHSGTKYQVPISAVVTPRDCSRCHPNEAAEYAKSKHANTIEIMWKIDPWLNKGMNSEAERKAGCSYCHGTVLEMKDGELSEDTWPNVGVGRINLDGSKGSCTSCHTRHRFSVMEARKPEACGQCHLGPDHPQIEIFKESKHGDIYDGFGDEYNWDVAAGSWTPGVDYRGPTCASCHMSGSGKIETTHDVTERLSWELQAPRTVRPEDFKAFPADSNWEAERSKMKAICLQCHGSKWVDGHYSAMDKVVNEYNTVYFDPAKKKLDTLYEKGLLDKTSFFDEQMEVEYYELWHHEGRRARMGAAMMAPDYSWWHGFYECKKRFNSFMAEGEEMIKTGKKAHIYKNYPNATGSTKKPEAVFGKK